MLKKIMICKVFSLVMFGICIPDLQSQNILFTPLKYNEPFKNIDTSPVSERDRDVISPWFVMADHENANVSPSPGSSSRGRTLRFGEIFWVIEEQGNYLRIAKDDRRDDFQLSRNAEIYGWVRKEDVLMWRRCFSNPETKISLKGMIMNTTKAITTGDVSYKKIVSYRDPSLQTPTDYEARLFEIFYIYKYSPRHNSVLLGRTPDFNPRDQRSNESTGLLIGWVDLDLVLEWDHRVAIEPNYKEGAIDERMRKNIRASIFEQAQGHLPDKCARDFRAGINPSGCEITWDDDLWSKQGGIAERKNGYWRRFPVVGDEGANIYEIMVMGELTSETGTIGQDIDIDVRQSLNEIIQRIRNINVVFVIDGTSSMKPYYQSVVNSVQRIVEIFQLSNDKHKNLKFGYAVYRDYLERDRILETRQLTSQPSLIINGLQNIEAIDYYDTDKPEAMYYGLRGAINNVFSDPNETNILIHLGDVGNHSRKDPSQVHQAQIVDLIAEYKCYYIAFQVHRLESDQAYIDFSQQIRDIMTRSSEKLYWEWIGLLGSDVVTKKPTLNEVRRNLHRIENGPPMVVLAMSNGQKIDLQVLENEITLAVEEIDKYTDMVVEKAREMLERGQGIDVVSGEGEGIYASSFAPGVYNMLLKMGLSEDMIKNYYSQNVQFVSKGYAPQHHQSLNNPLFSPVLLMTRSDFNRVLFRLNTLRQATSTPGDRRQNLYDAWMELLKQHVGFRPDSEFENLTLEKASSMVFGVPFKAGMLQGVTLKNIFDESIFPNTVLNNYIQHVSFKYVELEKISNTQNYPYSFVSNDILYYWIDVDMFP